MTVGQVARLAGVTVRTLHHYDELGLVAPRERTPAGYRLYTHADLARLQEVLFFRELGLGLGEIAALISDPGYDRRQALAQHRARLEAEAGHLLDMIETIDRTLQAEREGQEMSAEEMLGVFGDFDPSEYEGEVQDRWGGTDAYRQSAQRTASYTKDDWVTIQAEAEDINQAFASLMAAATPADDPAAARVVDRHREHISRWFYDCTPEIHTGLGQMYVGDARFTETFDAVADGLAQYVSEAIAARYRPP